MNVDFEERRVVVTGGAGALGKAVVGVLVESGAVCHLPVRDENSAGAFRGFDPARAIVVPGVDLASERGVGLFYAGVPSLWASIHLAGGFAMAPVDRTSLDAFESMMTMNARTAFLCTREAVRRMRDGGGRIVNVAAAPALDPRRGAGMSAYTASKAAVAALTQAVAEEVKGLGIWVNAVAPSILDTPANREAMPDADFASWPKVDEVARTIAFLASPENRAARGGIVPVFGRT